MTTRTHYDRTTLCELLGAESYEIDDLVALGMLPSPVGGRWPVNQIDRPADTPRRERDRQRIGRGEVLYLPDIARRFNVTLRTVRQWDSRNLIPGMVRPGVYLAAEVEAAALPPSDGGGWISPSNPVSVSTIGTWKRRGLLPRPVAGGWRRADIDRMRPPTTRRKKARAT